MFLFILMSYCDKYLGKILWAIKIIWIHLFYKKLFESEWFLFSLTFAYQLPEKKHKFQKNIYKHPQMWMKRFYIAFNMQYIILWINTSKIYWKLKQSIFDLKQMHFDNKFTYRIMVNFHKNFNKLRQNYTSTFITHFHSLMNNLDPTH